MDVNPRQVSEVVLDYDGFNNVISEKIFDFNGLLLRELQRAYVTNLQGRNYQRDAEIHLRSLVAGEIIKDGNGRTESVTLLEFDNYSNDMLHAPLMARAFPLDTTRNSKYGSSWLWRGNITSVTTILDIGSNTGPTSYSHYDVGGNVVKSIGLMIGTSGKRGIVDIEYDARFHFAYPIKTTRSLVKTHFIR